MPNNHPEQNQGNKLLWSEPHCTGQEVDAIALVGVFLSESEVVNQSVWEIVVRLVIEIYVDNSLKELVSLHNGQTKLWP